MATAVAVLRPASRNTAARGVSLPSTSSRPRSEVRPKRSDNVAAGTLPGLGAPGPKPSLPSKALPEVGSRQPVGGAQRSGSTACPPTIPSQKSTAPSAGRLPSGSLRSDVGRSAGSGLSGSSADAKAPSVPLAERIQQRRRSMSVTSGKTVTPSSVGSLTPSTEDELFKPLPGKVAAIVDAEPLNESSRGSKATDATQSSSKADTSVNKAENKVDVSGKAGKEAPPKRRKAPSGVEEDFEAGNWLSDASIEYASYCLSTFGGFCPSAKHGALPKNVMIMDPAAAFWLAMQDDPKDLEEARTSLKLSEVELMLCPINDSRDAGSADTGLHWTLLVCWCGQGTRSTAKAGSTKGAGALHWKHFRYYDSLGKGTTDAGFRQAEKVAARLVGKTVQVEQGACARQANFYDCGVYVLLYSELVATAFLESAAGETPEAIAWEERLRSVTPQEVRACREHYRNIASSSKSAL